MCPRTQGQPTRTQHILDQISPILYDRTEYDRYIASTPGKQDKHKVLGTQRSHYDTGKCGEADTTSSDYRLTIHPVVTASTNNRPFAATLLPANEATVHV